MPAEGPLSFVGPWQITRAIEDRKAAQTGRFEGTAVFRPDGDDRLLYQEDGHLRLPDSLPMQASRSYRWRFEGARVLVAFDDGRPFHAFELSGAAQADHWCDPDQYRVAYDFSNWPQWRAVWTVSGPRKDYVMDSVYTRA